MLSSLTMMVLSLTSSEHTLLPKRMRKETQVGNYDTYCICSNRGPGVYFILVIFDPASI